MNDLLRSHFHVVAAVSAAMLILVQGCAMPSVTGPRPSNYAVAERVTIGGTGGWDFVTLDQFRQRLFIPRGDRVQVWSIESKQVLSEIPGTAGVHGVALAQDLNTTRIHSHFLAGSRAQRACSSRRYNERFPTKHIFRDDANGDVLRHMQADGDDLSKSRDIDFSFVFKTEPGARAFAEQVRTSMRLKVEVSRYEERRMWEAAVIKNMVPTHGDITAVEQALTKRADTHGGKADGWGCF